MDHEKKSKFENIKKFREILKRYMNMNYSKKFLKSGKYHLVNSSVSDKKATGVFISCTGNSFNVYFDLEKETIKHQGEYGNHRNTPKEEIFQLENI